MDIRRKRFTRKLIDLAPVEACKNEMDDKKMSTESNQNVAKSVGVVFILSLVASLLSFVCEMLYANYYGVSVQTDAFSLASQLPGIVFAVITVSITTTVIPLYSNYLHSDGKERAQQFIARFSTLIVLVSVTFVIVCEFLAPVIIKVFSPGVEKTTFQYAVKFIRITFPTLSFTALMSVFVGVLRVHQKFGKAGILTVVRQCIYAAVIVLLHKAVGIYAAVSGFLIASALELGLAYIFTFPYIKIRPDFCVKDDGVLNALKMSMPIFAGIGAEEINRIVDKMVASFLESGSISVLNYASKLSGAFASLIIGAISSVMFPYFAQKAAKRDRDGLSNMFFLTLKVYLILTIPIVVGGVILRQPLVRVAFLRGAFTEDNAAAVAGLFAGYLLSMLFSAIRQTGANLFYAEGNTKTPMVNTTIGVVVNIILNVILGYFIGAMGLVLATVISTAVIAVLLMISARKYIDVSMWGGFIKTCLKTLVCAAVMAGILVAVMPFVSGWNQMIALVLEVILGMFVYGALFLLLGKSEIKEILGVVKNK